jgi:hypothetical protein
LLYHNALSTGVVHEDILKYAKKTKEKALDDREVIKNLERKLSEQEKKLQALLLPSTNSGSSDSAGIEMKEKTSLLSSWNQPKRNYGATEEPSSVSVAVNSSTANAAVNAATRHVSSQLGH